MTTRGLTAVPSWCAPRLRLLTPDGATVRPLCVDLPMADAEIVLGRDATSTIRLPDPWVSRRHAMISMRQGRLVLNHENTGRPQIFAPLARGRSQSGLRHGEPRVSPWACSPGAERPTP